MGGYAGAYGEYEGDYYFTSYQEAYRWLTAELDIADFQDDLTIANNFPIDWYQESSEYPFHSLTIDYFRRGEYNWDYAIFCNTYLPPYQLKNKIWPPKNTIHEVVLNGKPICVVLKRENKADYEARLHLDSGNYKLAAEKYREVLLHEPNNESALLNQSIALWRTGDIDGANSHLEDLKELYPNYEWAKEIKGEILLQQEEYEAAIELFNENLGYNYKFFHSYINLSNAYQEIGNEKEALIALKRCIWLNPFYKEAYEQTAKIYHKQGKYDLADKFFERAANLE
jgi:hypothetical protein